MQVNARDPLWRIVVFVALFLAFTLSQPEQNRPPSHQYVVTVQNDNVSGRTHVYFRDIK